MMDREYYNELKERFKDTPKDEAIKTLEDISFTIQQADFMNWGEYYACEQILKEIKEDKLNVEPTFLVSYYNENNSNYKDVFIKAKDKDQAKEIALNRNETKSFDNLTICEINYLHKTNNKFFINLRVETTTKAKNYIIHSSECLAFLVNDKKDAIEWYNKNKKDKLEELENKATKTYGKIIDCNIDCGSYEWNTSRKYIEV